MSEDVLSEFLPEKLGEKLVENEVRKLLLYYVNAFTNRLVTFINAAQSWAISYLGIPFRVETSQTRIENGVEVVIHAYIDPEVVGKIREVVERELKKEWGDSKTRLRALKYILADELRSSTGGVSALLSDMYSSTSESPNKTRRARAEVRAEERGSTTESS